MTNPRGRSIGTSGDDTVVAVYDNYQDAQNALQALAADGIARTDMQLQPETESTGTSSDAATTSSESGGEGGIRGFFRSLFGGDEHDEHRHIYQESVRRGSYILTIDIRDESEADRVVSTLNRFHPVDIDERVSHWRRQGWAGYDESAPRYTAEDIARERSTYASNRATAAPAEQARIPVIEEELKVGRREVQRGGIRIIKRIREIPVSESVQLRDEHIHVGRQAVDRPAGQAEFKEASFEVRETDEEAVVSKTARVVEEVVIGKEVEQRTERIDDTVRRTDVEVENLAGGGMSSGRDDAEFRRHWQSTYGTSGGRYEDYDAAYRYGTTAAGSDRYRNHQWSEVEPQLRSDWEANHPGSAWEKVKDAVRYGTERVTGRRGH
ncbi:YsnF/AvaK domain-containing protein [Noviherbaspirillum aridicola]|uniref:DUF2382 domain-containing protein n=1 Tax=Noviherbaspirillum aridicola TaxID=2849687 RepID=A0ABQ4Q6T6_9BURK|nr:YsnF/AvaK domain-containing protein [Noviherbaspirillum aridicola]GIZ52764.1 hypothetical protein NCCP691_27780 [Noviherbaspirillum aridicola]